MDICCLQGLQAPVAGLQNTQCWFGSFMAVGCSFLYGNYLLQFLPYMLVRSHMATLYSHIWQISLESLTSINSCPRALPESLALQLILTVVAYPLPAIWQCKHLAGIIELVHALLYCAANFVFSQKLRKLMSQGMCACRTVETRRIYICHMQNGTTEDYLLRFAGRYGEVLGTKVDQANEDRLLWGFVNFARVQDAKRFLEDHNGREIQFLSDLHHPDERRRRIRAEYRREVSFNKPIWEDDHWMLSGTAALISCE